MLMAFPVATRFQPWQFTPIQVDLTTGALSSNALAIQDALRLKARCACLLRALCGSSAALTGEAEAEAMAALSERLVVASAQGIRAWLSH